MQIKNVSPYGELYIPEYEQTVAVGEVVDVPDDDADGFLAQPFNWVAVKAKKDTAKAGDTAE